MLAPPAVRVVEPPPEHIELDDAVMVTVSVGTTVTVTLPVPVQPSGVVPVIVYVCVPAGLAVTTESVAELNPVAGLQLYVFAPLTVSMVEPLGHMVVPPVIVIVGVGFTVMVTCAVSLHPAPLVPTTEYVVVPDGLALGLLHVLQLNPVDGSHV